MSTKTISKVQILPILEQFKLFWINKKQQIILKYWLFLNFLYLITKFKGLNAMFWLNSIKYSSDMNFIIKNQVFCSLTLQNIVKKSIWKGIFDRNEEKRIILGPTWLTISTLAVLNNDIGPIKHIPHENWSQNANFKYKNYMKSVHFGYFRVNWTFEVNQTVFTNFQVAQSEDLKVNTLIMESNKSIYSLDWIFSSVILS